MNNSHLPQEVIQDINAAKIPFLNEEFTEQRDPQYNRIVETLQQVTEQIEEERNNAERYLFNHDEFMDALDHVVADQLSALKKEKISPAQWAERFNRWIVFCDAVVNLGITCLYSKDAVKNEKYEDIFRTLKINKQFELTFLKPRNIRVELVHKSKEIGEKYPWLAMPCLILKDEAGVEHHIAITPGPMSNVWWLDTLISFHSSYNWGLEDVEDLQDGDLPPTSIDDPYAPINARNQDDDDDDDTDIPDVEDRNEVAIPRTRFTEEERPLLVRKPVVETKPEPTWLEKIWTKIKSFFK